MSKDYSGLVLRMKTYEEVNRNFLIPNMNTILRLDGRSFSNYTKQFKKPFDYDFIHCMDETAMYLCSKIQGSKFAFVQSDEISICLTDYDTYETTSWYDGNIQKIVSVAASMAAAKFNHVRALICFLGEFVNVEEMKLAEFDARVFQVPNQEEVVNAILWRQQDCTRNSISAVAQSMFSHTELYKKNTDQMQEMIFQKSGTNWNDLDRKLKCGRFIVKNTYVNDIIKSEENYEILAKYDDHNVKMGGKRLHTNRETDIIRTKWESIEGPIISQDRDFLLNILPKQI